MTNKNKKACIICTFLPLNEEYKNLWNRISDLLSKKGFELVLLTSSEGFDGLNFPVIHIPFSLKGFGEEFRFKIYTEQNFTEDDFHLIERDIFWNNDSLDNYDKYVTGFIYCKEFYKQLIKSINPSIVFIWGNLLPQSLIFKSLLEKSNIPSYYLERGFFTGTLMIEDVLNKELNLIASEFNSLNYDSGFDGYKKLREYYFSSINSKYPENHNVDLEKLILDRKENGFRIITFYGTHDTAYFPSEQSYSKEVSVIFKYTTEAVRFLSEEISKLSDTLLIIKPHPNDKNDYSVFESENVFVTKNFYNKRLIELSDLVIVGNSTIQYEVLLAEKPVMLIAKSAIYNFNATYNPNSKVDFLNKLNEALNRRNFEDKLLNAKIFFESLLNSKTYFYTNQDVGRGLDELIEFVTANSGNVLPFNKLSERLFDFKSTITLHKQIKDFKEGLNFKLVVTDHLIKNKFIDAKKIELERKLTEYFSYLQNYQQQNLILQAEALIESNSFEEAKTLLNKAVEIPKYKIDAYNDLAYIEIIQENYSEAFNHILNVLRSNPNDEVAINNLNYLIENNVLENSFVNNQLKKLLRAELNIKNISSFEEFVNYEQSMRQTYKDRQEFEQGLIPNDTNNFYYKGYCIVCEDFVPFHVDFWNAYNIDGKKIPNWRERLVCPSCGLNNRMRLTYHLIQELFPDFSTSSVYTTEQTTSLFNLLRKNNPKLIGSEYLGDDVPKGSVNSSGIRNEDFTNLTFSDKQFDYIISLEVLEHIPDYKTALRESFRTLKSNGKFLFTVPFNRNSKENIVRAKLNEDGTINHILPPEYHGDPLNRIQGCLCYYHFGWELLEDLMKVGFKDARAIFTYSKEYGYLGGEQIFFIATKE
ncbi:MAG: methyltransferase domain-containing protein [Ignavibacterium sp.]|nr:methyltransferase domain-containing protein [Ignavibacterium sp.]